MPELAPRVVRNFWLEAQIDGCATPLTGGPKAKDGGFQLIVYVRDSGESKEALYVEGVVAADGRLQLEARLDAAYWLPGEGMLTVVTDR